MQIESFGLSNVGMKRDQNEDSYLINDELSLYIVADGMGGHLGGEFASRLAVATIEEIVQYITGPDSTDIHGVNTEGSSYGERLRFAIGEANRRIYDQALYDESLRGMGTTVVALLVHGEDAFVAHVGDSRAYVFRGETLEQLTHDHSLVGEQIRAGLLSHEEAAGHLMKNVITRSVGFQEDVEVDLVLHKLQKGDRILLCSDGLSNLVPSPEISSVLKDAPLKQACQRLIRMANDRGGDDNITVVMIEAA